MVINILFDRKHVTMFSYSWRPKLMLTEKVIMAKQRQKTLAGFHILYIYMQKYGRVRISAKLVSHLGCN